MTELEKTNIYKNRNFILLIIGQLVSNLGNSLHNVAVIWYILNMFNEGNAGSITAAFSICVFLPQAITGIFGGVFVDKYSRAKIIYGTDFIRGILYILLGFLTINGFYPVLSLFVITVISSIVGSFFNPAVDSLIPLIVSGENLIKANSLNGVSRQATFMLGAALAGVLYYKVGIASIFIINGVSFVISGISELFIKVKEEHINKNNNKKFLSELKEGLNYIRIEKVFLTLIIVSSFTNLIINPTFSVIIPKIIKYSFNGTAKDFGIFEFMIAFGTLISMIIISIYYKKEKISRTLVVVFLYVVFIFVGFGMFASPGVTKNLGTKVSIYIYYVLAFTLSFSVSFLNIPVITFMQKKVPKDMIGRVLSVLITASISITPIGLAIYGILIDIFPSYFIILINSIILFVIALLLIKNKEIKKI